MKYARFLPVLSAAVVSAGLFSHLTAATPDDAAKSPKPKYNVLFLVSDDMRWDISCNAKGGALTPNIDKVAATGVRFTNAYAQFPVCNPSRSSFCNGRYPTETTIVLNGTHYFRDVHPNFVTMPQYFKNNGYNTANSGKLFHGKAQDAPSWTEFFKDGIPPGHKAEMINVGDNNKILPPGVDGNGNPLKSAGEGGESEKAEVDLGIRNRILPNHGDGDVDNWIVANGIKLLEKYKDQDKPFFIAVGIHCPHAMPKAPQEFYDLYKPEDIKLPVDFASHATPPANCPSFMLPPLSDTFYMPKEVSPDLAKQVIRATRAATSYADWNLGRVLDALDKLGLADKTIVVIIADHGYHLGEKGRFGKTTVFDVAEHVPFIIRVPGAAGNGQACTRTVQLVDLYKTLADLCGLPKPPDIQGHSIAELINNPAAPWPYPALSMAKTAGSPIGYTARTEQYRYAEWNGGKDGMVLFDQVKDPVETVNLAKDPQYADVIKSMKQALKDGFGDMPNSIHYPTDPSASPSPKPAAKAGKAKAKPSAA